MGSKCDNEIQRKVQHHEGEALCQKLDCLAYYETSAREAIGVDEVFYAVASAAFAMEPLVDDRQT